jgi:hypothetical protein
VGIPGSVTELERTGMIVEALAHGSVDTLRYNFFELSLLQQHIRDDESEAMLDIIFSTQVFDVGYFLQLGGWNTVINDRMIRDRHPSFTSLYDASRGQAEIALNRVIEDFAAAG